MLDLLRQSTGGVVAKILIGLLVVSFAVWGVSGSILGGSGLNVVEVGETKVDVYDFRFAYETQYGNFARQLQRPVTREEADSLGLRQTVVAQLVAGAVLDESARKMGLGISDTNLAKTIGDDPNFTDLSGNFSRNALTATLRQVGMSEEEYVENRRDTAIRTQIIDGTASSLDLPEEFSRALARYQNEKRVFEYVIIGRQAVASVPEATDSDIAGYFEENKASFTAPEYRKIKFLKLQAEDISKPAEVSRDELESVYELRKSSFARAERRRIQQLVLGNADEANAVVKRLGDGETFEQVLASLNKSESDVDLGLLAKKDLPDQNLADAAFSLGLNQTSDVVDGIFGPVILKVSEIQPSEIKELEEVEDELRQDIALSRAADEVYDLFDLVEDERAAGATLVEAADKAGLTVVEFPAIDATGADQAGKKVESIPELPRIIGAVFETEPGVETDPVELGSDGFAWYEVEEVIPVRQKELAEVRSDVVSAWTESQLSKAISDTASAVVKRVQAGEDFNTVLTDLLLTDSSGYIMEIKTSDAVTREGSQGNLSPVVLRQGFNSAKGDVVSSPAGGVNHVVLRVVSVETGSTEIDDEFSGQLNEVASQDILVQVVEDLQSREVISINPNAMDAALGRGDQHRY